MIELFTIKTKERRPNGLKITKEITPTGRLNNKHNPSEIEKKYTVE